ncbi:MAG: DUF3870 domain-containing protein [Clostridia bacterium]|nr:DUF3870 domain-containing protein [Clostridia bacterium]
MSQERKDTIFVTGYAKLPTAITAEKLYQVIAIGLEVDPKTGEIIDGDCTLATELGRSFFKRAVIGHNIETGSEKLIKEFEVRYQGSARKAIITALKLVHEKWVSTKEKTILQR